MQGGTTYTLVTDGIEAAWSGLGGVWGDAAGHVSYLIIAISYWLTNIYWLRITAVLGLMFEVVYFVIVSDALAWSVLGSSGPATSGISAPTNRAEA